MSIEENSRDYAEVIGDPIAQSKSPLIHRFWLQELGLAADYIATRVSAEDLPSWLARRRIDPLWRGANVTMPHKERVMALLDRLSPEAERIGAVNTIIPAPDGALIGHNTDAEGFLEPLRADLAAQHLYRMARIIGTGGAARAIISALAGHGFTLVVAGRNPAKAALMLAELDPEGEHFTPPLSDFAVPTSFRFDDREGMLDLIVNASPLGMAGQPPLAFALSHAPPGAIFYDIVTHPHETELLSAAKAAGFRTIDGLSMLIGQAAAAFAKFYGVPPPRDGDAALRKALIG